MFPRPFETPKNGLIPFLRIGTHTRFVTTKSIMVTSLTTSFMNFIVIEIHVLPRQNLKLTTLLPSRQRLTSVERMIHSDRHESPTTLHCQNPCCIFERGRLASLMVYSSSRRAPLLLGPKCGTVANSSSRKKGLTKPGSLTNTNRIENTNIKELSFLYTFRGCYRGLYAIDRRIPSTQHRSSKGSRRPTKVRKPGSFRKRIPIRRVHNRMDKLTLTRQFAIQFEILVWEVSGRNWNVIISIHTEEKVLY